MFRLYATMFIACMCNTVANFFWKTYLIAHPFTVITLKEIVRIIFSSHIMIGIALYGCSTILFLYMLSNYALSVVVPLAAITYVLNVSVAYFYFHEEISLMHFIGICFILAGTIFVSQGAQID